MDSVIKFLSKLHFSILFLLAAILYIVTFYISFYGLPTGILKVFPDFPFPFLFAFGSAILFIYGANRFLNWTGQAIEQSIRDTNRDLIVDTDIPELCLDMLEATQQKHRYTNYEAKLENYSDWMAFQLKNGNHKMMGDVAEGINPTKLEEIIKNSFLASSFEGQRGAYDKTINEDDKEKAQSVIVTFDNAFIYRNKFLDWLLNHNWLIVNLFRPAAFIEIILLSEINLMKDVLNHVQIRIKMSTKAMSRRGSDMAEVSFALDDEDKPSYEEIIMMHAPLMLSLTEKKMEDSDTVEVIKFMQKFIKNTRKLVRKV